MESAHSVLHCATQGESQCVHKRDSQNLSNQLTTGRLRSITITLQLVSWSFFMIVWLQTTLSQTSFKSALISRKNLEVSFADCQGDNVGMTLTDRFKKSFKLFSAVSLSCGTENISKSSVEGLLFSMRKFCRRHQHGHFMASFHEFLQNNLQIEPVAHVTEATPGPSHRIHSQYSRAAAVELLKPISWTS